MITELGYLVVGTKDVARWHAFAERVIGAMVVPALNEAIYIKIDQWQHRMIVVPAEEEGLIASAWVVRSPAELESMRAKLSAAGVELRNLDKDALALRGIVDGFAFGDPGGNQHEIFYGRTIDAERFISSVGVRAFVTNELGLGHVVLPTGDAFDACTEFWETLMGASLSDFSARQTGGSDRKRRVRFYHLPNARQHSLAFAEIAVPQGLLHFMFEVDSIDEVGHAIDRCHKEGVTIARSLGRHVNDGVISIYIDTPSGFHLEFGFGGLEMDWSRHEPYNAAKGSYWGHVWASGG